MPAAPATQPRPKIGMRLTSVRRPRRFDQPRVDRRRGDAGDGDEEERVDVACAASPARPSAAATASPPTSSATRIQASFASPKVVSAGVLLDRQRQVAPADEHVPVQLLEAVEVEVALAPVRRGAPRAASPGRSSGAGKAEPTAAIRPPARGARRERRQAPRAAHRSSPRAARASSGEGERGDEVERASAPRASCQNGRPAGG